MIFMDVLQDNGGHGYTILLPLYDIVERCNIVQDRKKMLVQSWQWKELQ